MERTRGAAMPPTYGYENGCKHGVFLHAPSDGRPCMSVIPYRPGQTEMIIRFADTERPSRSQLVPVTDLVEVASIEKPDWLSVPSKSPIATMFRWRGTDITCDNPRRPR